MSRNRVTWAVVVLIVGALALAATGCGSKKKSSSSSGSNKVAALVSDIGRFNDRSFNQNQLEGLNRAKKDFGVKTVPLQSNSVSDYLPNLTTAIRRKSNLIISAGFLLASATNTVAQKYPDIHFAITDYPVEAPPFKGKG